MEDAVLFKLKIAAAIAVLRNKPPEANAREYTEHLCAQFLKAQIKWRTRYLQAQDALLHLKQQKAISFSNTPQGSTPGENICPPSPPSSTPEGNTNQTLLTVSSQQALTSSYDFIHSVVNLARAVQSKAHDSEGSTTGVSSLHTHTDLDILMSETIPTCANHLRMVVSGSDIVVSTQCVLQGLDGLVLLLNSDWTDSLPGAAYLHRLLLEHLGGLVDHLLQHLFDPEDDTVHVKWVQRRRLLHKMLLHLTATMRVPERYTLLDSLVGHVRSLCKSLGSNATSTQPDLYECLAIALDCLHHGISTLKISDVHLESLRELQSAMEGVLNSGLVCRFPLVANTVLRLTSLMELSAKAEV